VASIESLDSRCLDLLRQDGKDREHRVRAAVDAHAALLFQLELPAGADADGVIDALASEGSDTTGPVGRLCRLLGESGALHTLEVALPGDERRTAQLLAVREAVPVSVNHRIASVQRSGHPQVRKTAADMVVPFEHLPDIVAAYRREMTERALDHAIWGHVSDGNLHVNVLPRNADDVAKGDAAILAFGREVVRVGGSPLAEHGVGRNPQKQALLEMLYGTEGVAAMRATKSALDPDGRLAPGVLWPRA
jgi:D-lactate dehydrogenase (cytochrome)